MKKKIIHKNGSIFVLITFVLFVFTSIISSVYAKSKINFEEIEQKAKAGNLEAQYQLALNYLDKEYKLDNRIEAFYWIAKAAESGFIKAQSGLSNPNNSIKDLKVKQAMALKFLNNINYNPNTDELKTTIPDFYKEIKNLYNKRKKINKFLTSIKNLIKKPRKIYLNTIKPIRLLHLSKCFR